MKKYALFVVIILALAQCRGREDQIAKVAGDTAGYTRIQWIDSIKNIGIISSGKTQISFKFKNTGEKPLYIIAARPGCGCTVADYPKQPIVPKSTGIITADFTPSSGADGDFRKNIVVTTNTKGSTSHFLFFLRKNTKPAESITKDTGGSFKTKTIAFNQSK